MLRQSLQQKLFQKLSPQQIQLMKLLQIPTAELESRVKEELEANPALQDGKKDQNEDKEDDIFSSKDKEKENEEPKEEIDLSEYLSDDDYSSPDYKENSYTGSYNSDDDDKVIPIETYKSFHEFLMNQVGMLRLNEKDHVIADQIVGSIGDDGYLRRDTRSMVNDMAFSQNLSVTEEEIEEILSKVQQFEPAGVGARDLRECLLLQIRRDKNEEDENKLNAFRILDKHFDSFAKKHYKKLESKLGIDTDQLRDAIDEILKLNPKPASAYTGGGQRIKQYIVPDFIIQNNEGELTLTLNSRNAPDLQVNREFKNMMKTYKESKQKSKEQKEAVLFIKRKLDSAKWFIEAIKQRQQTLLGTMSTIMDYQKDFFLTGDEMQLRPMILKDIAEVTGLDISTVSRVANSKYVQTEFGTYSLKYFFSESLQTEDGEEASTREVKRVLQNIIDAENKKKPFSDQKLMEALKNEGYNIARRTVAKYREQLNIPVARLRKEI